MDDQYSNASYDPSRKMWKGVFYATLLGLAITGLIGSLVWFACVAMAG